MTILRDRLLADRLRDERRAWGGDHHDEVWEGVPVMSPLADNEHQDLIADLVALLHEVIRRNGLGRVHPGTNVSDGREDWTRNYRCPDVAVFLNDTAAENRGTHWAGDPDLAVEIASPDDATREKIPFYAQVGTRELLIVERDPWVLELLRLENGSLVSVGRSTVEDSRILSSETVPLTFRLVAGDPRPRVVVDQPGVGRSWTI